MLEEGSSSSNNGTAMSYAEILLRKSSPPGKISSSVAGTQREHQPASALKGCNSSSLSSTTATQRYHQASSPQFSNAITRDNPKFHSFPRHGKTHHSRPSNATPRHRQRLQFEERRSSASNSLKLSGEVVGPSATSGTRKETAQSIENQMIEENKSLQNSELLRPSVPLDADPSPSSTQSSLSKPSFSDILRRNTQQVVVDRLSSKKSPQPNSSTKFSNEDNPKHIRKNHDHVIPPQTLLTRSSQEESTSNTAFSPIEIDVPPMENVNTLPISSVQSPLILTVSHSEELQREKSLNDSKHSTNAESGSSSYAGILTKGMTEPDSSSHPVHPVSGSHTSCANELKKEGGDSMPIIPVLEVEADLYHHHDEELLIPGLLFRGELSRRSSKRRKKSKPSGAALFSSKDQDKDVIIQEFKIPDIPPGFKESYSSHKSESPTQNHIVSKQKPVETKSVIVVSDNEETQCQRPECESQEEEQSTKTDVISVTEVKASSGKALPKVKKEDLKSKKLLKEGFRRNSKKSRAAKSKSDEEELDEIIRSIAEQDKKREEQFSHITQTSLKYDRASSTKKSRSKHKAIVSSDKIIKDEAYTQILKRLEVIEGKSNVDSSISSDPLSSHESKLKEDNASGSKEESKLIMDEITQSIGKLVMETSKDNNSRHLDGIHTTGKKANSPEKKESPSKKNSPAPQISKHESSSSQEQIKLIDSVASNSQQIKLIDSVASSSQPVKPINSVASSSQEGIAKKSYELLDDTCDAWMTAGIGDLSDSEEEKKVEEPPRKDVVDSSSAKTSSDKAKKSYDLLDDTCDAWMTAGIGDLSDSDEEKKVEELPRKDVVKCSSTKTSSDKAKKSYDLLDDTCDAWMTAGIGDISDSEEEKKVEELPRKDVFDSSSAKTSSDKAKKSYDLLDDTCDAWMTAGIGDLSDSEEEKKVEEPPRKDVVDSSSAKTSSDKAKKSYDLLDDTCDAWMTAGIGDISDSEEEKKVEEPSIQKQVTKSPTTSSYVTSSSETKIIDKTSNDFKVTGLHSFNDREFQKHQSQEMSYSSVVFNFSSSKDAATTESSEPSQSASSYSYPALIVAMEDNKPLLPKELDSEGFETVLTKREKRKKLNSLRLSASECESAIKEIQEIIDSDIDRGRHQGDDKSNNQEEEDKTYASSGPQITLSSVESRTSQSSSTQIIISTDTKVYNESAVKKEYQNELTKIPLVSSENTDQRLLKDSSVMEVSLSPMHPVKDVLEESFKSEEVQMSLSLDGSQDLAEDEEVSKVQKNASGGDSSFTHIESSVVSGNANEENAGVPYLEKPEIGCDEEDMDKLGDHVYIPISHSPHFGGASPDKFEKSLSPSMLELDKESSDVIRNLVSNVTSATRPSSRSSFSESRFEGDRRYLYRKRDSMDSGRSSSVVSSMSNFHRKYVRIRDTPPFSNNNSKSGSLADLSSIRDRDETSFETRRYSHGYPSKENSPRPSSAASYTSLSLASRIANICNSTPPQENKEDDQSSSSSRRVSNDSSFLKTSTPRQYRRISETTTYSSFSASKSRTSSTSIEVNNVSDPSGGSTSKNQAMPRSITDKDLSSSSSSSEIDIEKSNNRASKKSKKRPDPSEEVSSDFKIDENSSSLVQPSSLSSLDESHGGKVLETKEKVMKKRKRLTTSSRGTTLALKKKEEEGSSTNITTDSDEVMGGDPQYGLTKVNMRDLTDSLIEENEEFGVGEGGNGNEEESSTSDDEEFEELKVDSKNSLLWSTLAGLPPRPHSPIPRDEEEEESSKSKSIMNPKCVVREKESPSTLSISMHKRIFDKDGYEIHVSRRTRTNSRNSMTELDEASVHLATKKPPQSKSILDLAQNNNHFMKLGSNKLLDECEGPSKAEGPPHLTPSESPLRVRAPQSLKKSTPPRATESELSRNLLLEGESYQYHALQFCINDAELFMSRLWDGRELGLGVGESSLLSSKDQNVKEEGGHGNVDDDNKIHIGHRSSLGKEETENMKMPYFQELVFELSEDVQDLGVLLRDLNETEIEGSLSSIQYALKSVPQLDGRAKELERRIQGSNQDPMDSNALLQEMSGLQKDIRSFESKVKSLESSMEVYLKESQRRKDQIQKYHSLLLDLEGWCDGMELTPKTLEASQSKDYYSKSLNSAKVLEHDLKSRSQELSSLLSEAHSLSKFGDVKKMSETLICRLQDLKKTVDATASMLPERINILKVQRRSYRTVFVIPAA